MRALNEISRLNADPRAARADDAAFGRSDPDRVREQQRLHGERVEARQRERNGGTVRPDPLNDLDREHRASSSHPTKGDAVVAGILADLVLGAVLADAARTFTHLDRIHTAIDAEPPFLKFWQKLNDERAARGEEEAFYAEAKKAFLGGETPLGALTFIGKEWDGLRAVPAEPVTYLGGSRPAYHGEYRVVSDAGTVWHKAVNRHDSPIIYALPEAALLGAKLARTVKEHH